MSDFPIIRIELEGIKSAVATAFGSRHKEMQAMVEHALNETLTEEWVQQEIKSNVKACIRESIRMASNNHTLQYAIQQAISESVAKIVSPSKKTSNKDYVLSVYPDAHALRLTNGCWHIYSQSVYGTLNSATDPAFSATKAWAVAAENLKGGVS